MIVDKFERKEMDWGNDGIPEDYMPSLELRLEVAGMIQRTLNGFWESRIIKYITTCEKEIKRIDYDYINLMIDHYTGIEKSMLFLALDNNLKIQFDGFVKKGMANGLPRRFKVTVREDNTKLETITSKLQDFYGKPLGALYKQKALNFKAVKEMFREDQMKIGNLYEVLNLNDPTKRMVYELEFINMRNNEFSYAFKCINTGYRLFLNKTELYDRVRKLLY